MVTDDSSGTMISCRSKRLFVEHVLVTDDSSSTVIIRYGKHPFVERVLVTDHCSNKGIIRHCKSLLFNVFWLLTTAAAQRLFATVKGHCGTRVGY